MATTLNRDQLEIVRDFCDEKDISLRTDYSGRGMYGQTCIGFVTDDEMSLGMDLIIYLKDAGMDDVIDIFRNAGSQMDSMGLSTIVYFPSISVEE
jgi:hypothetical protein